MPHRGTINSNDISSYRVRRFIGAVVADVDSRLVWIIYPVWPLGGKISIRKVAAIARHLVSDVYSACPTEDKSTGDQRRCVRVSSHIAVRIGNASDKYVVRALIKKSVGVIVFGFDCRYYVASACHIHCGSCVDS